jgi:hypothetical protein
MKLKLIALLLFVLSVLPYSEARSSYLVKVQTLKTPNGNPIILERLYGDAVDSPPYVRLQLRNEYGVVEAYSSAGTYISIFCPSLDNCWAFPYIDISIKAERLIPDAITLTPKQKSTYSSGLLDDLMKPKTIDLLKLQNYLTRPEITSIESPEGTDPRFASENRLGFQPGHSALTLLGPIIIFLNNPLLILLLIILYYLPAFGLTYLFQHLKNASNSSRWLIGFGAIALFGCVGIALIGSLRLLLDFGLFYFQLITALCLVVAGMFTGKRYYLYKMPPRPLKS